MTLIEGVGDEVLQFFVLLFLLLVGLIAWWSTSISDRPLIRTVLILERRTTRRAITDTQTENNDTNTDPGGTQHEEENKEEAPSEEQVQVGDTSDASETVTGSETSIKSIPLPKPVHNTDENNVLRNRRLRFFENYDIEPTCSAIEPENEDIEVEPSPLDVEVEPSAPDTSSILEDTTEDVDIPLETGHIRIRLKYLNDDQKLVEGNLQEQLGDFKKRHFNLELAGRKLVRLIFNGQVLQHDSKTLQNYGFFDNCVVHCLIHQPRQPSTPTSEQQNQPQTNNTRGGGASPREWDLGNVFLASVSFLLGIAWYGRYQYAQWYSATATVALVGLTGIFTVSLIGMYLPDADGIRQH